MYAIIQNNNFNIKFLFLEPHCRQLKVSQQAFKRRLKNCNAMPTKTV